MRAGTVTHFFRVLLDTQAPPLIYDPNENRWTMSAATFQPPVASGGDYFINSAYAHYDSASDVIIMFLSGDKAQGAYVYDPAADRWQEQPVLPGPKKGRSAFYHAELNAHYFFDAGDSDTKPGDIWVRRYKNPAS